MRWIMLVTFLVMGTAALADCGGQRTQSAINDCLSALTAEADGGVEALQRQLLARLPAEARPLAEKAHASWITYRRDLCDLESWDVRKGSMHGSVYEMCARTVSQDRAKLLRFYLTCSEEIADRCVGQFK